jgi:hypothetical protein
MGSNVAVCVITGLSAIRTARTPAPLPESGEEEPAVDTEGEDEAEDK